MFNDELTITSKKMHEFSVVDGFVEITESSAEMIKYIANEPSVGLFYVQQHTRNAMPNLINLKNNVENKSHELTFHTEDMEDSILMVRSMKGGGFPIVDDMINDIKKSISIMSSKQPKRGLINPSSSGFQMGKMSTWRPVIYTRGEDEVKGNFLSSVFKSAKWAQLDPEDGGKPKGEKLLPCGGADSEGYELPVDGGLSNHQLLPPVENFDQFRAEREAKLEEWLGETKDEADKI